MDYSFGFLDTPPTGGGVIVDHLNNSAKNSPIELRRTVLTRRTAFYLNTNHMNNNYYNLDMESLEDMLKKVTE